MIEDRKLLFGRVGSEQLPASLSKNYRVLTMRLGVGRKAGTFNTDVERLRGLLGSAWNPQLFDLLNVMCALRAADRYFASLGMFRVQRTIPMAVGVSSQTRWSRLRASLVGAVDALSGDTLRFYPIQLRQLPHRAIASSDFSSQRLGDLRADCVCLFSGGADSFAGAAFLLSQGRRPIFVSHSVGPVSGLQRRLFEVLCRRFQGLSPQMLIQIHSYPNAAGPTERRGRGRLSWIPRDPLQRLRSAFFFSAAGIVSRAINADELFICENGLIGAAIVFTPRDDSPYTPHPAEPHFLRAMQEFLREALAHPKLTIRNPFQYMTKGEVVSIPLNLGLGASLHSTVSCWRSGNRGVRNCGQCVPCLFRQLAFAEAGLPPPPRRFSYKEPIPARRWREWRSDELPRLEDIRRYCMKVIEGGLPWLRSNELAVIDAVDVSRGSASAFPHSDQQQLDRSAPAKMARVIQRFARATLKRLS